MEKFIIKKEEHIQFIIDNFDFKKVSKVMHFLDWTWFDSNKPPTIDRLKEIAKKLLNDAYYSENGYVISTGGFKATKLEDFLKLEFVIKEKDSEILNHGDRYERLKKQKERNKKVENINNLNL